MDMNRPRPREASGVNPLLKNRALRGRAGAPGQSVIPNGMAKGAQGARMQGLKARAMAARAMKGPAMQGGVA